jgi:hypothetical protein
MSDYLLYSNLYIYGSFLIILFYSLSIWGNKNIFNAKNNSGAIVLLILLTLYCGTFPYNYGDRALYANGFIYGYDNYSDLLWAVYTNALRPFLNVELFLLLTGFIYICGFYLYSRKTHPRHATIMMMGFLGFLFFKAYGVNTMRAGIAASVLFYALTYSADKLWKYLAILLLVVNIHFSMALSIAALLIAKYFKMTKYYFYFWILCIPLSFVAGTFFQGLFEPYLADYSDKATGYLIGEDERYKSGFRWDFIFYSVIPVLMGYYYIYKKQIKDTFYNNIFNTYLIANSFWILVIRANFSDRMAYLSWIFIPVLMLYPPLKYKIWKRQNKKIAYILLGQELFTFMLSIR